MKLYKTFLHFLLTSASIAAFLMGWASFAHSLKPIQPTAIKAAFAPLPPVGLATDASFSSRLKQFFSASPSQPSRSRFVSRGS